MTWGGAPRGALAWGAQPGGLVWPSAGPSERVLILSPRDSDQATLTSTTAVSTLPVSNLLTIQPAKKWRSTSVNESIGITLPYPVSCNALALVGHNLSAIASLRLRGSTSLATIGSPGVDTSYVSAWPLGVKPNVPSWPNWLSLIRWTAGPMLPYWQLDISDPGNSAGYLEAGRLVIGQSWQPSTNFDIGGAPLGFDQADVQVATPWGYTFTDRRTLSAARTVQVQVSAGDLREILDGIAEQQRTRGQWGDVVVCLDPAATTDFHRFSMQGLFVPKPSYPLTQLFTANGVMLGATLQFRELL